MLYKNVLLIESMFKRQSEMPVLRRQTSTENERANTAHQNTYSPMKSENSMNIIDADHEEIDDIAILSEN